MELLDATQFTDGGIVREAAFFEKVDNFNWAAYKDKRVLVKGCGTTLIPPWAFMVITARLTPYAKTIRYGNDHSSIPVYRRAKEIADVGN